jgi:hypothetical protein
MSRVVADLDQREQILLCRFFEGEFLVGNHRCGKIGQPKRNWITAAVLLRLLASGFILDHLVQGFDRFPIFRQPLRLKQQLPGVGHQERKCLLPV